MIPKMILFFMENQLLGLNFLRLLFRYLFVKIHSVKETEIH